MLGIRKSIVFIVTALLTSSQGYGQEISEKIDKLINSYYGKIKMKSELLQIFPE